MVPNRATHHKYSRVCMYVWVRFCMCACVCFSQCFRTLFSSVTYHFSIDKESYSKEEFVTHGLLILKQLKLQLKLLKHLFEIHLKRRYRIVNFFIRQKPSKLLAMAFHTVWYEKRKQVSTSEKCKGLLVPKDQILTKWPHSHLPTTKKQHSQLHLQEINWLKQQIKMIDNVYKRIKQYLRY